MSDLKVKMPVLKEGAKPAVLCAWLKDEGEFVKAGEPLFEVELEKVVMQVEAEHDGIVKKQLIDEGDEVEAGAQVAVLAEEE